MKDQIISSVIVILYFFWGISQIDHYGLLAVVWLYLGSIFYVLYIFHKGWVKW